MISKKEICNQALAEVSGDPIGDLSEDSHEARSCSRFYDQCLRLLLEEADWPFATRLEKLSKVQKDVPGWRVAYTYPSDCSGIQKIIPHELVECDGADFPDINIPHRLYDDDGDNTLIVTNADNAYVIYTAMVSNVTLYPASFSEALVLLLASKLANPIITGREGMQIARDLKEQYKEQKNIAIANQASQQKLEQHVSELIRAYDTDNLRDTRHDGIY